MKRAEGQTQSCQTHDSANLAVLPLLSLAAVGGLLGYVSPQAVSSTAPASLRGGRQRSFVPGNASPVQVTNLFLVYIVADLAWLLLVPDAIPALRAVVVTHHIVTFLLLLFPFFKPEFAIYTCWDGLTEINTTFVVGRRFFRQPTLRRICTAGHWATFFPLRFVLYPALVLKFWEVLEWEPLRYRLWMCGSQAALCGFNCLFLRAIIKRTKLPMRFDQGYTTRATRHAS